MGADELGAVAADASTTDAADAPPSASADSSSSSDLPAQSIRHIMCRSMGGEQAAITTESVEAVQRCTSEFISFIVSEARSRVTREGRESVSFGDMCGVLGSFGFKCVHAPKPRSSRVRNSNLTRVGRCFFCCGTGQALPRPAASAHDGAL